MFKTTLIGWNGCLVLAASLALSVRAEDPVKVRLRGGRVFEGWVDARSDASTLWLRHRLGATVIWRSIPWRRIETVNGPKGPLSRKATLALATEAEDFPWEAEREVVRTRQSMAESAAATLASSAPVRQIDFSARLADNGPGARPDSLILDLFLLDAAGGAVAASGTVEVTWVARYDGKRSREGRSVRTIGRWSRPFTTDGTGRGARIRLPLRSTSASTDRRWAPTGLVSIRVVVPGHGTFTASRDFVRTRPPSPTRDAYHQETGRDVFGFERSGR